MRFLHGDTGIPVSLPGGVSPAGWSENACGGRALLHGEKPQDEKYDTNVEA